METATEVDEREAKRLELAKRAAGHELAQAALKELRAEIRTMEEAEKARVLAHKESTKGVQKKLGKAMVDSDVSGKAVDELRQGWVREESQALSAAKRDLSAAARNAQRIADDVTRGRSAVLDQKDRSAKVPGSAPAKDVVAAIKRAEAAQIARESDLVVAKEAVDAARARLEAAQKVYDAALSRARAL